MISWIYRPLNCYVLIMAYLLCVYKLERDFCQQGKAEITKQQTGDQPAGTKDTQIAKYTSIRHKQAGNKELSSIMGKSASGADAEDRKAASVFQAKHRNKTEQTTAKAIEKNCWPATKQGRQQGADDNDNKSIDSLGK